jgi:hypothetical protein
MSADGPSSFRNTSARASSFQIPTVESMLAVARNRPSAEKATYMTVSECMVSSVISFPILTNALSSRPPDARIEESDG